MGDPIYLAKLTIAPEILKAVHIKEVAGYLSTIKDMASLLKLMGGENELLHYGNASLALSNFNEVHDSIPDGQSEIKNHAKILLEQAQLCL